MILAPRYEGPTILSIGGAPDDQLQPFTRQRGRMLAMVGELTPEQWTVETRCAGWTAREVIAHLIDVDNFWNFSIQSGLAGTPSRVLAGFDPAASPPQLVERMSELDTVAITAAFIASSEGLLATVAALDLDGWQQLAESPAGLVPIRLVVQHALWDCWIHERDIALPLDIAPPTEADEVGSCLRYAAAISPVLGMGLGHASATSVAVEATDPDVRFVLTVTDSVAVHDAPADDRPCLRGDAVELVEALSLRAPMPASTPPEWITVLGGLAAAFDAG